MRPARYYRRRSRWAVLAILAGLVVLSNLDRHPTDTGAPGAGWGAGPTTEAPKASGSGAQTAGAESPAGELLESLTVTTETDPSGYDRAQFGAGWQSGADGCDTRDRVLAGESRTPVRRDRCTVVAGDWLSAWDNTAVADPAALDIDHLVPLAEAWTSGAASWDPARRVAFANDLNPARPDALVAVTAKSNRAKGDGDPAQWMPPARAVWCRYATAWITQKHAWHLSIDPAERQALADALDTCTQPVAGSLSAAGLMTADGFLATAISLALAGLALAWWLAHLHTVTPARLGRYALPPLTTTGPLRGGSRPGGLDRGVDIGRVYADAQTWASHQTTATLVELARVAPDDAGDVFVWAAAHRILSHRGVTPLPLLAAITRPRPGGDR